jgi:NAD-dependent deacetylase
LSASRVADTTGAKPFPMQEEDMVSELYERARKLVKKSRRAVALTGAGHSTPSGIPDFRSPGTGLWSKVDPMQVASIQAFIQAPHRFYEWYIETAVGMTQAEPNPAHFALAQMEERGVLQTVVTQNIDGLHQRAGSQRVLELHGSNETASCLDCGEVVDGKALLQRYAADRQVPHCECGGLMKPDVVLFGEMLPADVLRRAQIEIAQCDLLIIAGSSLTVAPASQLPWLAIQSGAPLIICNLSSTWADPYAEVILREDVAKSLPALLEGW